MKYNIEGGQLPVVICQLESGEKMITEKGAMAWMSPNFTMETKASGGLGKSLGRMLAGDSIFQNIYTANGAGEIAFSPCLPGSIKAIDVGTTPIIAQKSAFLASEAHVELSVFLQKKIGTGLFGGEGFIMQKMEGNGTVFLEISGSLIEYDLAAGQEIVVSSGQMAYMSATCSMEILTIKGAKNVVFGGEGLFNLKVRGPGKVVLQTLTARDLAEAVIPFIPSNR